MSAAPGELGYAPTAPARPRRRSGPQEEQARDEFEAYMRRRRGGPPPRVTLDTTVLTMALIQVGRARRIFIDRHGHEPTAVEGERMSWQVVDELAKAVYGTDFASVVGKAWWPPGKGKEARPARRILSARLDVQEWTVGA